jgi:hypothetical protein
MLPLQFRPVKDLKETLLHEMIHAALFLGNVRDDGDHGPKFRALMNRINNATCADSQVLHERVVGVVGHYRGWHGTLVFIVSGLHLHSHVWQRHSRCCKDSSTPDNTACQCAWGWAKV